MKWKVFLCLVLFLAPSVSWAQESFEDRAWTIPLLPGEYGKGLNAKQMDVPVSFSAQIDSVNSGRYYMVIEVTNDPTGWKLLQYLAANKQLFRLADLKIEWDRLQKSADGGINVARQTSTFQLLIELGLKSKRIFVRSEPAETVYIKVYAERAPWVVPVDNNRRDIRVLEEEVADLKAQLAQSGEDSAQAHVDTTGWNCQVNFGLMAYANGDIDLDIIAFKVGATFKKDYRRWDLSLGGSNGGSDNLGDLANVMVSGRHSWMFHGDQPDTTDLANDEVETTEEPDDGILIGGHLGSFAASQFYTDVNEYSKLSYGLLVGATFQLSDHLTVFASWAPALSDKLDTDLRGSFKSGLLTAQVEF